MTLPFTGRVVGCGVSGGGPFVRFELDQRWGFGYGDWAEFRIDADALEPIPTEPREVSVNELANWLRVMGWRQAGTMDETGPGAGRMAEFLVQFLAGRVAR